MRADFKQIKEQEAELLSRLQKGDEKAFAQLFYAYKDKLHGFVLGITRSEQLAEDLLQDVFLKIWQNRSLVTDVDNFNAYIYSIARNQVIDSLRRFARETCALDQLAETALFATEEHTPLNKLENKEILERIHEAIRQLPPQQQKVYILHKEKGLKIEDIAEQMNLSVSTIRNHMMHATSNLRRILSYSYLSLFLAIFHFIEK